MIKIAALVIGACLADTAPCQTILYDTFNEADQSTLYDCCNYVQFGSTKPAGKGNPQVSVPFTVPIKTKVIRIDIPLFAMFAVGRTFKVELVGEHGNKHAFLDSTYNQLGECCEFQSLEANGVPVAPGVQYSLLVHRRSRDQGGWSLNTIGATGDYTVFDVDGEHLVNGVLPAVRIIGR